MKIAALAALALISALAFLHIGSGPHHRVPQVQFGWHFDLAANSPARATDTGSGNRVFVFSDAKPPRALLLNGSGGFVRSLDLRLNSLLNAAGEKEPDASGDGYVTAPVSGDYYIWYPRIGSHIYLYGNDGRFLWRKEESRYLQAFQDGKWLMAMAGDQSRVHFFKPDLSPQMDFEGYMLISWNINRYAGQKYDGCLGFFNGDIIFLRLQDRFKKRFSLNRRMKSLSCDLLTGDFAAQVESSAEKKDKSGIEYSDSVIIGRLTAKEPELDDEIPLNRFHPYTLPMVSLGETVLLVREAPESAQLCALRDEEEIWCLSLPATVRAEDLRGFSTGKTAVFRDEKIMLVADENSLIYKSDIPDIRRVFSYGDLLYLQGNRNISVLSFR